MEPCVYVIDESILCFSHGMRMIAREKEGEKEAREPRNSFDKLTTDKV